MSHIHNLADFPEPISKPYQVLLCWTYSVVTISSKGSSGGVWEQVHFGVWLEGICISMMALVNSWASLKVDGERIGVLGGVAGCINAGGRWTSSVVAEDSSSNLNGLLAKFDLRFCRGVLTWNLGLSQVEYQWASRWVAPHCRLLPLVISYVLEETRKFQQGWISAPALW